MTAVHRPSPGGSRSCPARATVGGLAHVMTTGANVDLGGSRATRDRAWPGRRSGLHLGRPAAWRRYDETREPARRPGGNLGPPKPPPHVVIKHRRRQRSTVVVQPQRIITAITLASAHNTVREIRLDGAHQLDGKRAVTDDIALAETRTYGSSTSSTRSRMRIPHNSPARAPVPTRTAARARSRSGHGFRPYWVVGARRKENARDLLVPLDVMGEGSSDLRPLDPRHGQRIDGEQALANQVRAELLHRPVNTSPGCRSRMGRPLDRRQGVDERRRGQLVDRDPLSSLARRRRRPPVWPTAPARRSTSAR